MFALEELLFIIILMTQVTLCEHSHTIYRDNNKTISKYAIVKNSVKPEDHHHDYTLYFT